MSEPAKANRENVFRACDQLFAAGKRITIPLVREVLGGGSPNSLHRYVREWEAHQRERFLALERMSKQPPADDVPEELWRVLVPIWERLVEAAKAVGLAQARDELLRQKQPQPRRKTPAPRTKTRRKP